MVTVEVDKRFVTYTSWQGYSKFLEAVAETRTRITYDRGKLELMSPGRKHERIKSLMGSLFEALMRHHKMKFVTAGSTTFRREDLDRGLEPDDCFWIAHALEMSRDEEDWDPNVHPPPDLVLEVDVSSSSINRMGIYGALGVPEVWRYNRDGSVTVHVLNAGTYSQVPHSPTFPQLSIHTFAKFVQRGEHEPTSDVLEAFEKWLRSRAK